MEMLILPEGNGQNVYMEPNLLKFKKEWYSPILKTFCIPNMKERQTDRFYLLYKHLFSYLFQCGYHVIIDSEIADSDTFFFTPCHDTRLHKSAENYRKQLQKDLFCVLKKYSITEPKSVRFLKNGFPTEIPDFPFVLKNEHNQGGKEKFLIENETQLNKVKQFYRDYRNRVFDDHDDLGYQERFFRYVRMQEYIKTPTPYNTSLRVLVNSVGRIMTASLKYADPNETFIKDHNGYFDRFLSEPDSLYYIGEKSIISNTVSGGNSILFAKKQFTDEEKAILTAHQIDSQSPAVPSCIADACKEVAITYRREFGAVIGLDFIFDDTNKEWKYLEEHEFPMLFSYAEQYHFPYNAGTPDFRYEHEALDVRLRLETLKDFMEQENTRERAC